MGRLRASLLLRSACNTEYFPAESDLRRSGRQKERQATDKLLAAFQKSCRWIDSVNYLEFRDELKQVNSLLQGSMLSPLTKEQELLVERVTENASYSEIYEHMNDIYYSLIALAFMLQGSTRDDIAKRLRDAEWTMKHEVLTRWGWMNSQRELIEQGVDLKHPFYCRVAHRGEDGRNQDREFYYLLLFLHGLRVLSGQELLFENKCETPDFSLLDSHQCKVGAEMTEAPQSTQWAQEMDAQSKLFDKLDENLRHLQVALTVTEPASWIRLCEQGDKVVKWIGAELVKSKDHRTIYHEPLGVTARIDPGPRYALRTMGRDGHGSDQIRRLLDEHIHSIYSQIKTKIWKGDAGQSAMRERPKIRPCHLVIYPSSETLMQDNAGYIVSKLRTLLNFDISSHFDKIWLVHESLVAEIA